MLQYLRLRGAPAFSSTTGVDIGPFKPVTFLFGPNGSGKTTISRAFADPSRFVGTHLEWESPTNPLGIKVYNRDYASATLTPAGHLPGVFLLGETNAEIQAEIDGLTGPNGSIAAAKEGLVSLQSSLSAKSTDVAEVRNELKKAAWAKRDQIPSELRTMFTGYNNNKDRLLDRLLEVAAASPSTSENLEELKLEAAAVFVEDAQPITELPLGRELRIEDIPNSDLLEVAIVGSADVRIAPLIQKLQNADWIQHGREYLGHADGLCPFCQQQAPSDLADQIDAYFDRTYVQQVEQLKALQQSVHAWAQQWHTYLDELQTMEGAAEYLDAQRFAEARLAFDRVSEDIQAKVSNKLSGPSVMVTVASPTPEVAAVNAIVGEANSAIQTFNLRLKNRAAERKKLLDRCWVVFARVVLATEVGRYEGAMPGHMRGKERIEARITTAIDDHNAKEARLRELQAMVTSSKPIIDRINRLLESVGFHSFCLAESAAIPDAYTLVRENGEIASETLSEGERTFITFLYFAQSLQGAPSSDSEPQNLLAIIDDPISSLDSDVLYAVSTLVRRIVEDVAKGSSRVHQLLLMTHNAHFHKEVTYRPHGGPKLGSWKYGIVRKRSRLPSEVVLTDDNPIQTAYGALWDEVKRASDHPSNSVVGLQNTLRRILETYFKVLGGVDDPAIVASFEGDDQLVCRTLFTWVNAGSHSIFDDLDYSPTPSTVESNLRVFRRIFEVQNQIGHYLMMMGLTADKQSSEMSEDSEPQLVDAESRDG